MIQKFQCNECSGLTELIVNTDKLPNSIERSYAECEQCGYKSTIQYTDKNIRSLLAKQRAIKPGKYKVKLAKQISDAVDALRFELER